MKIEDNSAIISVAEYDDLRAKAKALDFIASGKSDYIKIDTNYKNRYKHKPIYLVKSSQKHVVSSLMLKCRFLEDKAYNTQMARENDLNRLASLLNKHGVIISRIVSIKNPVSIDAVIKAFDKELNKLKRHGNINTVAHTLTLIGALFVGIVLGIVMYKSSL